MALAVAAAAAVMGGVALARSPGQGITHGMSSPSSPASASAANSETTAAAKKEACNAWRAAAIAMNTARKPFVNSPPERDDPITANALAQSEAAIAVQVTWLRQHVPAATPPDVAAPIQDYLAAMIDVAGADGQPGADAEANAAADRSSAAANRIKAACRA